MARTLDVALIGASGYWAQRILPNLNSLREIRVRALVSHRTPPAALRSLALTRDVLLTRDLDRVLADESIGGVVVATSTATHSAIALKAIDSGKHVFLEKPPALTSLEARAIARRAARRGAVVVVDHIYLFSKNVQMMDALIGSGKIGEPLHFFSRRANFGIFRTDSDTLSDLGYHDVYLIQRFFRGWRAVSVMANTTSSFRRGFADVASFSMRFAGGPTADVFLSWLSPSKDRRVVVAGTEGIIEFRNDSELLLHRKKARLAGGRFEVSDRGSRTITAAGSDNALRGALRHFARCALRGESSTISPPAAAAETVRWQEKIRRSALQGRRIRF